MERLLNKYNNACRSSSSYLTYQKLISSCNIKLQSVSKSIKIKHQKKLAHSYVLHDKVNMTLMTIRPNKEFVINLSNYKLNDEELRVLSYELNYAFPARRPLYRNLGNTR